MLKAALTLMSWLAMYANGATDCTLNGGMTKTSEMIDKTVSSDVTQFVFPSIYFDADELFNADCSYSATLQI